MKLIAILMCAGLVAGCAEFTAAKVGWRAEAAFIADEVRDSTEFMLCRGMTVGAWVRAYAADPQKAEAWRVLCTASVKETPGVRPVTP